jgi:hypothetical protein
MWARHLRLVVALACAAPVFSFAAEPSPYAAGSGGGQSAGGGSHQAKGDVAALRAELDALKSAYAERIAALEARIAQLESAAAADRDAAVAAKSAATAPEAAAAQAPVAASPPAGVAGNTSNAFNPAISLILVGNYASLSSDPNTYHIAGFIPSGGDVGPGARSFNLGETELTVAANVDPYFFANATISLTSDDQVSVEEAYFKTIALPSGFSLKGGRFFSGVGYLNEIHSHAWDFIDQPLVYQAMFGGQYTQDGAQLKWLAPTDTFIEFGAETGNGRKFPGTLRDSNGLNGTALFVHVGGDIGDSTSWRTGVSWLDDRADGRSYDDTNAAGVPVTDAFTGTSRTWVVDTILKWAPHGDVTHHQLKLQGEYMHRTEDGQLAFDVARTGLSDFYRSSQSGWYVQAVYQFVPRWRAGVRYDSLDTGTPRIGLVQSGALTRAAFPALLAGSPERTTVMLDWTLTEFSRLRAQFAWDDARSAEMDHQFFLQYIFAIGAHGAHKF